MQNTRMWQPWQPQSRKRSKPLYVPAALVKSKARDISACMRILHEQYHDKVPEDFNALLKLPGVGRKKRKPNHG